MGKDPYRKDGKLATAIRLEDSHESRAVRTLDQLDALILDLHSARMIDGPELVQLIHPSGDTLFLGLGHAAGCPLNLVPETAPPSWMSRGTHLREGFFSFRYLSEESEFGHAHLVTLDEALAAARYFAEFGGRSPQITWESD